MARSSLLVHMVMIVIAGAIGYLYIFPTIGKIRQNQDMAVVFDTEVTKVSAVNAQLQQKLVAINSIPLEDKQKLVTYMPDTLDDISFLRTMEAILIASGIEPSALKFGSGKNEDGSQDSSGGASEESTTATDNRTVQSDVSVSFETTESALFSFFDAVEQSAVPFVIKEMTLAPSEKGGITAELVYTVHALASTDPAATTVDDSMNTEMGMELGMDETAI